MKSRAALACSACLLLWVLAGQAVADKVILHNGKVVEGKVVSPDGAGVVEIETKFGTRKIVAKQVKEIQRSQGEAPEARPDGEDQAVKVELQTRRDYAKAKREADKATTGAEGRAVWERFLSQHATGPLAELAKKEQVTWRERAEKNLVRFGPQWLPREQVQERMAKADELLAKAEAESDIKKADALFDAAMKAHPFRADIPYRKAMRWKQAGNLRNYGRALGQVVRIEADHVVARNNLGVLSAQQKQWATAFRHLGKAAANAENDVCLDNLDQAIAMAEADGYPASSVAAADGQIQQIVKLKYHANGERLNETRWGNTWIPIEQYKKYEAENAEIDRRIAANNRGLKKYESVYNRNRRTIRDYRRLEDQIRKQTRNTTDVNSQLYQGQLGRIKQVYNQAVKENKEIEKKVVEVRSANQELESKRNRPPHAGRLVVLDIGGGQSEAVDSKVGGGEKDDGGLFD